MEKKHLLVTKKDIKEVDFITGKHKISQTSNNKGKCNTKWRDYQITSTC